MSDLNAYFREAENDPAMLDSAVVEKPVFAPPAPVVPVARHGVYWRGPSRSTDGTGLATRRHAAALAEAGVPVMLQPSISGMNGHASDLLVDAVPPDVQKVLAKYSSTPIKEPVAIIHHSVLIEPWLRGILFPARSLAMQAHEHAHLNRFRVLYTVFERDRVDPQFVALMGHFAQVWVPCQRNAQALRDSGLDPALISVVPHPVDFATYLPAHLSQQKAHDPFFFYHIGKWEPRKNQHEMLGAFLQEFKPTDPVKFALKTGLFSTFNGYPADAPVSLRIWLEDTQVRRNGWRGENVEKGVRIISTQLSEDALLDFHVNCNCYVNVGHGEAWDLPAFDAVMAGNRLIHVGFGGSEDYAPPGSLQVWTGETERTHPGYHWGVGHWARVSRRNVSAAMRRAFEERATLAQRPPRGPGSPYSYETVGAQMRGLVERLCVANGKEIDWSWTLARLTRSARG